MIKFPKEDISCELYKKHAEEARKMLEASLRMLGSFKKHKPIIISDENFKFDKSRLDIVYTIKDDDETIFIFKNFAIDSNISSTNRYEESYHLLMQRKNSSVQYKYDFSNLDMCMEDYDKLRVVELKCELNKNRILKLKMHQFRPAVLIIEENDKKYTIIVSEEKVKKILETFEKIVERIRNIKELNIENIFSSLDDISLIYSCYIEKDDILLGTINMRNGKILSYKIREKGCEINTSMTSDAVKRTTSRRFDGKTIQTEEKLKINEYIKIETDIKKLIRM